VVFCSYKVVLLLLLFFCYWLRGLSILLLLFKIVIITLASLASLASLSILFIPHKKLNVPGIGQRSKPYRRRPNGKPLAPLEHKLFNISKYYKTYRFAISLSHSALQAWHFVPTVASSLFPSFRACKFHNITYAK